MNNQTNDSRVAKFEEAIRHFGIEAALEYFDVPEELKDFFRKEIPATPLPASSQTEVQKEEDKHEQALMKYLTDSMKESEFIYGKIQKIAEYGGSIFAIYGTGGKCYRLQWQSYNQDIVTTDANPVPPISHTEDEAVRFAEWIINEFNNGNIGIGWKYDWNGRTKTTQQLFQLFKEDDKLK